MSGHHHAPTEANAPDNSRKAVTSRVAMVGMAVNIFLTIAQIIGGILTHSQALVADAMHTLSDLVGDIVVLFAAHHAGKAADAKSFHHGVNFIPPRRKFRSTMTEQNFLRIGTT